MAELMGCHVCVRQTAIARDLASRNQRIVRHILSSVRTSADAQGVLFGSLYCYQADRAIGAMVRLACCAFVW